MITDARVLRDEWVPPDPRHRNGVLNELSTVLDPLDGVGPGSAFLHGPPGVGKTTCARFIVEELRREVLDVEHAYVSCWTDSTRFAVLRGVLDAVGEGYDVVPGATPRSELVDRLRGVEAPLVVVLDEVDTLREPAVLYDLHERPNVGLVLVANREDEFFAGLDDRVRSRLRGCRSIGLQPYDTDQLVGILRDRVREGLSDGAVSEEQLTRLARAAGGDARSAITMLRLAARACWHDGGDRLTDDAVDEAIASSTRVVRQSALSRLNRHQRLLYELVYDAGELSSGELHDAYERRADDPVGKRSRRKHLRKLRDYDLVLAEGDGRWRTYRVVDPAPEPR